MLSNGVISDQPANNVLTNHPPEQPRDDQLPQLYVDRLLDTRQPTGRTQMATNVLRVSLFFSLFCGKS